eukprot:9482972-Pyramimonas_sp.AAC.1
MSGCPTWRDQSGWTSANGLGGCPRVRSKRHPRSKAIAHPPFSILGSSETSEAGEGDERRQE